MKGQAVTKERSDTTEKWINQTADTTELKTDHMKQIHGDTIKVKRKRRDKDLIVTSKRTDVTERRSSREREIRHDGEVERFGSRRRLWHTGD